MWTFFGHFDPSSILNNKADKSNNMLIWTFGKLPSLPPHVHLTWFMNDPTVSHPFLSLFKVGRRIYDLTWRQFKPDPFIRHTARQLLRDTHSSSGVIHKPRGQILKSNFDPSTLRDHFLNKAYAIKWSFG